MTDTHVMNDGLWSTTRHQALVGTFKEGGEQVLLVQRDTCFEGIDPADCTADYWVEVFEDTSLVDLRDAL